MDRKDICSFAWGYTVSLLQLWDCNGTEPTVLLVSPANLLLRVPLWHELTVRWNFLPGSNAHGLAPQMRCLTACSGMQFPPLCFRRGHTFISLLPCLLMYLLHIFLAGCLQLCAVLLRSPEGLTRMVSTEIFIVLEPLTRHYSMNEG